MSVVGFSWIWSRFSSLDHHFKVCQTFCLKIEQSVKAFLLKNCKNNFQASFIFSFVILLRKENEFSIFMIFSRKNYLKKDFMLRD